MIGSLKGQNISWRKTTPFQDTWARWACTRGTTFIIARNHCETCPWGVGSFWGMLDLSFHMWMAKCIQSLAIVPIGLQCMLCGKSQGVATVLVCDHCFKRWHMGLFTSPFV
jgi:hypothetical protein